MQHTQQLMSAQAGRQAGTGSGGTHAFVVAPYAAAQVLDGLEATRRMRQLGVNIPILGRQNNTKASCLSGLFALSVLIVVVVVVVVARQ
jgi:hypothetical protein